MFFFKCLGSPCSLTLCNQTVLTSLPGHSSILKCHGFTKKGFYFVFAVCMHISKSFLYFVSLSNLHTQNTLKLHDDFNLLHYPTGHALEIWICGCSPFYKSELWASKSVGAHSTKSLKSVGAKGDVPKICWCVHPLHPC